ncbi:peptidase domain-containing ABC transporter [Microbacterium testaceum]|uniref:peptidase domain-containing ABC transporter n=1 Tax=Microbacterium testaceum TaxID=2033 RepID=UPI002AC48987|nr:peptidase domain-containing ABC transporter [Microbacterium testaceum]MDZ5145941.1 peptidase domain-containing ABC transporter [Microbacterium testaceum]
MHIQQNDRNDCAAACLAMITSSHGRPTSVTSLRDALGTGISGTSLKALVKGAEALGLEARAVRVDMLKPRDFAPPVIAHVMNESGDPHFVVIHKVRQRSLLVSDPGRPRPKRMTHSQFAEIFTGVLVLLAPSESFSPSASVGPSGFARFVDLLRPQKGLFVWAVLSSLLLTGFGIAGSMITKVLFDEVVPYGIESLLMPVFFLFLAVYVLQHVLQFVRQWMILHLSQRIDIPLILGYFRHVYSLPFSFFSSRHVGDILTRFGDAMTIKNILTGAALTVIMDVVMAVITGAVLFSLDRSLFGVVAVFVVASIILILAFRPSYRRVNQQQMEQASVLNSRIIEGLRGVEGIKIEAHERREMESLESEYVKSLRFGFREGMLENGQSTLGSLFQSLVSLSLIVLGASRILSGDMSLGTLMAFVALSAFFVDPVVRLIGLQLSWQEANLSLKRVVEILDYGPERRGDDVDETGPESAMGLSFNEVSYSYNLRSEALRKLSFTIEPGEKVAFVGPSGSGKSTVAKLLASMHEPTSGQVALNDVPMGTLSPASVRTNIGYVPQSVHLYSKSVAENVRMSRPDASTADVRSALIKAGADEFVERLPQGAETVLEEAGAGLSGGERRRLGLARALLKSVGTYVFDEVTSDLDSLSEARVMDSIFEVGADATLIFVAHRLASVARCDRIFVLDKGKLVESGSHEQLMAGDGLYTSMWNAQHSVGSMAAGVGTRRAAALAVVSDPAVPLRYLD